MTKDKNFFSLIELMVVMAIILAIGSLLSPALYKTVEQSRLIACQGNLRPQFHIENNFSDDHNGKLFSFGTSFEDRAYWRYWNAPTSKLSPYLNYEILECPSDPHLSEDKSQRYSRDGISFGRNMDTKDLHILFNNIQNPSQKIFYADSGHRYSAPIERDKATRRNLSSSIYIKGKSNWNNEGIFNRHRDRDANVLFFDGHLELAIDVHLNLPESLNYSYNDEVYNRHWVITE